MRMIIILVLLVALAGCVDPIEGGQMHRAIASCEPNGGVNRFYQPADRPVLIAICKNGASGGIYPEDGN